MSHISTESYGELPQFLASAVGLRTITEQIPQSLGVQDGKKLIVKAGTIFPANDDSAVGVIFDTIDVTDGDHEGPIIVAGHLYGSRLPVAPADAAKTAMAANGYGGVEFENPTGMVR